MLRDNFRSLVLPIKQRFGQAKNAPQMTLSEVLSNQSSVREFREFLRKEFSQENLDFIIDVDQLLCSYSHDKVGYYNQLLLKQTSRFRRSSYFKSSLPSAPTTRSISAFNNVTYYLMRSKGAKYRVQSDCFNKHGEKYLFWLRETPLLAIGDYKFKIVTF